MYQIELQAEASSIESDWPSIAYGHQWVMSGPVGIMRWLSDSLAV